MPSGKGTHWAEEGGRGKEGTRQAAAEDMMSGDRERAGWRKRHDEWRQRAHRLAEGRAPGGQRGHAEWQGNSLGGGGGDREMEGTRQAAAEDTMSGDRERAGRRQRHDEWQQRAHRLAEGRAPGGKRGHAERQGNSLGGGRGVREGGDTPGSGGGDVGRWNGTRRQEKGRGPTAAFWGGFSGQKRTPPPTRSEGASALLKSLTWCQRSGRRRRRGRGRCSCFR